MLHGWQAQHNDCAITGARNEGSVTFSDNIVCKSAWEFKLVFPDVTYHGGRLCCSS